MKQLLVVVVVLVAFVASAGVSPKPATALEEGVYVVTVTRSFGDWDTYDVLEVDGVFIKTRWCYEYVYSQRAYLVWDGDYSWRNKLLFIRDADAFLAGREDPRRCEVEGIYRRVAGGGV